MPYTAPPEATKAMARYEQLRQEREVRLTAQDILTRNLRLSTESPRGRWGRRRMVHLEPPWPRIRLDLAGALLIGFTLSNCRLAQTNFERAQFIGPANFSDAQFTDEAIFTGAQFTDRAEFGRAEFNGRPDFGGAQFSGQALFDEARFSGRANFGGAQFTDEAVFDTRPRPPHRCWTRWSGAGPRDRCSAGARRTWCLRIRISRCPSPTRTR